MCPQDVSEMLICGHEIGPANLYAQNNNSRAQIINFKA